jgi:2-polyprenyl-3-methyl-5-hydroxy-6-metoxy-1,4-benzoquinol methylase
LKRGYQENFYEISPRMHDITSRQQKAEKIIFTLKLIREELKDLTCLDIGCSNGAITSYLQPYFKNTIGIDYDKIGISLITAEQKSKATFLRGDAMYLPFSSSSFDVVICAQVYEHMPDENLLFSEISRVIKPDGIVSFSGPNKLFPIEPHYLLPFLHWLPIRLANIYLKMTGKGNTYYERSRTIWELQKKLIDFNIYDMTLPVIRLYSHISKRFNIYKLLLLIPKSFLKLLIPFEPTFSWVMVKNEGRNRTGSYDIIE